MTHNLENDNNKEVLPLLGDVFLGFPAWGSSKRARNPQGIWLWRPAGFDYRTSTGLGETETPLLECTNKILHKPGPWGKEQWPPQETEPDLSGSVGGSPVEAWVSSGAPQRQRHWQQQSWEVPIGKWDLLEVRLTYHRAWRLQGWIISGQTTNREGVQPHPPADNWIKVWLSPTLPTRTRPSFPHRQSLSSASTTRGQTEQELQSCSLQEENHNHRKLTEMKRQRIISQMKKVKMSVPQSCLTLQPCGL